MAEGRRLTEHYRLDRLVRTGDKGLFFAAVDSRSGQPVAVEMIREAAAERGGQERARFLATAATLHALEHPSLPKVLDYGFTAAGNAFLITEPVSGSSLASLAGSPPRRVLALLLGVLDGVAALAQQGLALPRLRAEGILATETAEGERVKLVELGEAVPAGDAPASAARRDLAFLACHLLGATLDGDGRVDLPPLAAGQLEDVAALEGLLSSWLRPAEAGAAPTFEELRRRLRFLLGGGLATLPATPVDELFGPAASPPTLPDAAAPGPARRRFLASHMPWSWIAAAGAFLLPVAIFLLVVSSETDAVKKTPREISPTPSQTPPPSPPPTPPPPAPSPLPAEAPRLARAEGLLADRAWESLRRELAGITPAEREAFTADEGVRHQRMLDALAAADAIRLAADLARGFASGSVPELRSAVGFASRVPVRQLKPGVKRDLERAKDAVAADAGLTRAEKSGDARRIVGAAADLLALLPANARAQKLRDQAASSLEAAAEAAFSAGRLDEAGADLEAVRSAAPQRPGLADRLARLDREQRGDQSLASALAEAARLGEQGRPLEGLARLARATPNDRYRDRFARLDEKLDRQLAELDRGSPQVKIGEGFEASYEKDQAVGVPLRITDDYAVKSVEAWVTVEGGKRKAVPVVRGPGEEYEASLAVAVHGNQNVELWVAATDHSGHRTELGPTSLRRKRWYDALGLKKEPQPP